MMGKVIMSGIVPQLVASVLPSGYTKLSYIRSSGTQYVNSGIKANQNTRVVIDFEYISGDVVFGAYDANGENGYGLQAAGGKWYIYYGNKGGGYSSTNVTANTRLVADLNKNVSTLNGNALMTATANSFTGANPIIISGLYNASAPGFLTSLKIYSCQIYDNGVLVRDFVPCTNDAGAVGLFDMVERKFYGNAGTGAFIGSGAAGILASDIAVGSTVKLMEGGNAVEYLVVNQGKPSGSALYDDSCTGTWLLRKDIYENRAWHSANSNAYAASTIHSYLNSTFLNRFGSAEKGAIKQVKIPYVNGTANSSVASGSSGLSAKVFLLSGREVGGGTGYSYVPADGEILSFFIAGYGSAAIQKRVGYLNGTASTWMLRSPVTSQNGRPFVISEGGDLKSSYSCLNANGVRPALILPSAALFDEETLLLKGVA